MIIVETERLLIRHFSSSDLEAIYDLFGDYETIKFIGPRRPMSHEEAYEWLEQQLILQKVNLTRFAVSLKESNELIGVCGLKKQFEEWDFGYYFRKSYWGNGYAFETCNAVLPYIKNVLGHKSFVVFVAYENLRSKRLLFKLGFTEEDLIEKEEELGNLFFLPQ